MMTIADISALQIYAEDGLLNSLGNPCTSTGTPWSTCSAREIKQLARDELGIVPTKARQLHVLFDSKKSRVRSEVICNHIWSGALPAGSLYYLVPGILIASPQLCCLLAARTEGVARTAAIMMECTGLYGKVSTARGFADRSQLITVEQLADYIGSAEGAYGVKVAREALCWVCPRSRSPLETKVILILILPPRLGGYGLPKPELNYLINFAAEERSLVQSPYYEVDACWPGSQTVLEVQSYANHLTPEALDNDAKKLNSLQAVGWHVIQVTNDQLSGVDLDILANQVAAALGVDVQQPSPSARDDLIKALG